MASALRLPIQIPAITCRTTRDKPAGQVPVPYAGLRPNSRLQKPAQGFALPAVSGTARHFMVAHAPRTQGATPSSKQHTSLHELYEQQKQSPWLDNLRRDWIQNGEIQRWVDKGVRGMTSNPTIFQKAIMGSDLYDDDFKAAMESGLSVEDAFWNLVVDDIKEALKILRPIYDSSSGTDGFVSIEVEPHLANDSKRTESMAREFHQRISQPNLMVKIPATKAGLEPIRTMISEGRSINVTLIFSLDRYEEVIDAYIEGLEACEGDLSKVASVASFFISRVDVEVDKRLDDIGTPEAKALKGKAAVAQGKLAYELFERKFSGPRWEKLKSRGARVQRPLWASTGTKNKAYSDVLYVESLVGPNTVNTAPEATLEAFLDHGKVSRTVDLDLEGAHETFRKLESMGINVHDVSKLLEEQGVASFSQSGEDVYADLEKKAAALKH